MRIKKPDMQTVKNIYGKTKKVVKEKIEQVVEKTEPFVEDFKQGATKAMFTHKTELYSKQATDAKRDYLLAESMFNLLKSQPQQDFVKSYKLEQQVLEMKNKAIIATEKYNKFDAREKAAQEAFERLNK